MVEVCGLIAKPGVFETGRLGANDQAGVRVIDKNMTDIGMCRQNMIQVDGAGLAGSGEVGANVIHQVVGALVELLLGDLQHLGEIALNRRLHPAIALDGHQMKGAQDHQCRGWQYHGQFKTEDQTGSIVRTLLGHG